MDMQSIVLHYPNMLNIPTYALYGETSSDREHDWLHCETIQSRSRLHDYRIAPHRHEHLVQVLYLTGGTARVSLDDEHFKLTPGTMVVVPPLIVHGYAFSEDVEGLVLTLLERDTRALELPISEAVIISSGTETCAEALEKLIEEADNPGARHDLAMPALITLLMLALHRARDRAVSSQLPADRARLHATAFRTLVDRQFRHSRRIADYAGALGISQTHLNRVCRQVLGASALEVIERRIALEARRQLLFSTLSIKQIGAELGYEDPAYFTRFITRLLGMPPGHYRRETSRR